MDKDVITIDFSDCEYIGELHREIKEKLDLPDWYGMNKDALWDSVTGIMRVPCVITINYFPSSSKAKRLKTDVEEIISIFREAEIKYHEFELHVKK